MEGAIDEIRISPAVDPVLAIMALGLAGGALLDGYLLAFAPPETIPVDARPDFQLKAEAWNTIQKVYVEGAAVKPQRMTYGAISGMVDALGDTGHSRSLTPEMLKQERYLTKGELNLRLFGASQFWGCRPWDCGAVCSWRSGWCSFWHGTGWQDARTETGQIVWLVHNPCGLVPNL